MFCQRLGILQNQNCESGKVLQEAFGTIICGSCLQSTYGKQIWKRTVQNGALGSFFLFAVRDETPSSFFLHQIR